MKKSLLAFAAVAALASSISGCSSLTGLTGKDSSSAEFDKETNAEDASMSEDRTRMSLGTLESAVADYVKTEQKVPEKLDLLIPKYLAQIPSLDVPVCGGESNGVQIYPAAVLRDGQVDGTSIRGTGRWGYVFNDSRVVIFVDCLKPSSKGIPWYQVRGVY
jgi:predicted small secreted protein